MVASACGSILKRIFQVFAYSARLTSVHMPGGDRLPNWATALTPTRMPVNDAAIGDDHVTRSRRPNWRICAPSGALRYSLPTAPVRRSVRPRSGTPVALRHDRWPRLSREIRPIWRSCLPARVADHSAQRWLICAARIVVLTRVRSLVFAGGVHRGLAGERVHGSVCPAGPGLAPSASLSWVQTFMLTTMPMISRISSGEKCSASAS